MVKNKFNPEQAEKMRVQINLMSKHKVNIQETFLQIMNEKGLDVPMQHYLLRDLVNCFESEYPNLKKAYETTKFLKSVPKSLNNLTPVFREINAEGMSEAEIEALGGFAFDPAKPIEPQLAKVDLPEEIKQVLREVVLPDLVQRYKEKGGTKKK